MKNPFQKRTSISAIEAEMATLAKRRHEVAGRIADVHAALDAARLERRETLSSDGDLAVLTGNIRELTLELADLEALTVDIDNQGEDAAARLTKATDDAERAASAGALEKIALAAELRVPEVEKAVAALAKAILGLKADLREDVGFFPAYSSTRPEGSVDDRKDKATSREVVAAIVAEVLAKAAPWMFDVASTRDGYRSALHRVMDTSSFQPNWASDVTTDPLGAAEIVQALISGPLRERASAIRAGDAAAENPSQPVVADEYVRPLAPANVNIFVTRSFSYFGTEFGPPMLCGEGWTQSVPLPVAKVAEDQDLAVRATSARGEGLIAAARNRKGNSETRVSPEDCIELGDVMDLRADSNEMSRQAVAS